MRKLHNLAAASALALMAADTGNGGGNAGSDGPKDYRVVIGPRNSKDAGETQSFVIRADSYKLAWERGREVTRTGSADFAETHHKDGSTVRLMSDIGNDAVPSIKAGVFSVKKVESLQQRTAKKDALTVERLVEVMAERNIRIPAQLQSLIDELNAAGPAQTAEPEAPQEQAAG